MFRFTVALALLGLTVATPTPQPSRASEYAAILARHPFIHNRIVGGEEVTPNSKPWMVSVQTTGGFHFCGGSILREDIVMTAAHCVDGDSPSSIIVHGGEHNLFESDGTEQESGVSEIIVHEDYGSGGFSYNDIAILVLDGGFTFNDEVSAIALPEQLQAFEGDAEVMGWGTLSPGGSSPDVLHAVTVPLVSDESCRDSYGESDIADHMICAGEAGKDSCQGDSGGPMNCFDGDNPIECGIVSWGFSCAEPGYPGVYTEVAYFIDWMGGKF